MPRRKLNTYTVEYHSNLAFGNWYLKDEEWRNLEEDGWVVRWAKTDENYIKLNMLDDDGRYMGALARSATLTLNAKSEVEAEIVAKVRFEEVTNQRVDAEGCPCCGPPHSMYIERKDK